MFLYFIWVKGSFLFVLIHLFLFQTSIFGQDETEWKLVKSVDGIHAYVQKQLDTKVRKVKVETIATAQLSELISIIKNAKCHKDWVFLNKSACILEEESDYCWKYYAHTNSPWPVFDRDFITDVVLIQDSVDYSVKIVSIGLPDYIPEKEDCVRIRTIFSQWTFNPLGNGSVFIKLEIEADIGGKIPVWLVNLVVTKGPLSTMEGLLNELQKENNIGVTLDYIKEL